MRVRATDRGQVAPLLAVLVVLSGFVALFVAELGGKAIARARARTAADAGALAGAAEGYAAAVDVVRANGGTLDDFVVDGPYTEVRVRVGDATATARAEVVGVDDVRRAAAAAGLCQPSPTTDPLHFEPCQLSRPG